MPIGKYERKPYMRTFGKALTQRSSVLRMAEDGVSSLEIARKLDMDVSTVKRLKRPQLDWGNYQQREKGHAMTRVIHIDDLLDSDKRLLYAGRLVGYVYIGRTLNNVGPWGNRYTHKPSKVRGVVHVASAEEAILKFYRDLKGGADLRYGPWENVVRRVKAELAGKVLVCWCRRGNRPFGGELVCHGQLYAAIADDVAPEDIQ